MSDHLMSNLAITLRSPLVGFLLLAAVFAAFQPALNAKFVWDDDDYVTENPNIRDLDGLIHTWTSPETLPQYYPLVHTSYWIEYQLWGLKPAGYHIVNLLLHALASWLLFLILLRLEIRCAILAVFFFAVHPVQVESVVWVTERKNCLSIVFYFASILSWLSWWPLGAIAPEKNSRFYGFSLFFFLCALLSKTVTCSLPAAILVLVWWKLGRVSKAHIRALLPFFVLGLGMAMLTTWLERNHVLAQGVDWELSFFQRILIASRAIWFYFSSIVWPVDLSFNYVRWVIDTSSLGQWIYVGAFVLLMGGLIFGRKRLGRGPLAGVLLYGGTLFPALGFIDVYPMRYSFVADHFQYLATPYLIVLLLEVGLKAVDRLGERGRKTAAVLMVSLLLALGYLTYVKSQSFRDLRTLWSDTIEKNPRSWLALLNLGVIELNEGNLDVAARHLERSLELKNDDPDIYNNLGVLYFQKNDLLRARASMEKAQVLRPESPQISHNLGVILWDLGERDGAKSLVREVLKAEPHYLDARATWGRFLLEEDKYDDAHKALLYVVDRRSQDATSRLRLARALRGLRQYQQALNHLRVVLQAEPGNESAREEVALCLRSLGKDVLANGQLFRVLIDNIHRETALDSLVSNLASIDKGEALAQVDKFLTVDASVTLAVVETLAKRLSLEGRALAARVFAEKAIAIAKSSNDSLALRRLRLR